MAKKDNRDVVSHWGKLIDNFHCSAREFYSSVERGLRAREVPEMETSRVLWAEGGALTPVREYLRVERARLRFDICCAPFGRGQFFSWWLVERIPSLRALYLALLFLALFATLLVVMGMTWLATTILVTAAALYLGARIVQSGSPELEAKVLALPIAGSIYDRVFRPFTYYRVDTAKMFESAVHAAVLEVLDGLTKNQGIRALSDLERRPILSSFPRRSA